MRDARRIVLYSGVLFNYWYPVIVGAIFDWLPLPTGWMKSSQTNPPKNLIIAHIITTLIAYAFASLWIISPHGEISSISRFLFLEIWWIAVISGIFIEK